MVEVYYYSYWQATIRGVKLVAYEGYQEALVLGLLCLLILIYIGKKVDLFVIKVQ